MAGGAVRATAEALVSQVGEVAVGVWLLFLLALATVWDPIDRRFGFGARR